MTEHRTSDRFIVNPSRATTTLLIIALAGLISVSCGGGGGGGSGGGAPGEWNQMNWDQDAWG